MGGDGDKLGLALLDLLEAAAVLVDQGDLRQRVSRLRDGRATDKQRPTPAGYLLHVQFLANTGLYAAPARGAVLSDD